MTNSAKPPFMPWPIFPTICNHLCSSPQFERGAAIVIEVKLTAPMECPRCGAPRTQSQSACSACGKVFNAYGHPGLTLCTAQPGQVLCTTCRYHQDGTCDLPDYPQATECTLYRDLARPAPAKINYRPPIAWGALIGITSLIALSIILALAK